MKKLFIIIGMLAVCSMAQTMTDSRDGKTYKTVKIGNQVWMAENLNAETEGSVCFANGNTAMSWHCKKYGRLYTWETAKNSCPAGWHLPSIDEFAILLDNLENSSISSTEFPVLTGAGRYRAPSEEFFGNMEKEANFWTSSVDDEDDSFGIYVNINENGMKSGSGAKYYGVSVRCLEDDVSIAPVKDSYLKDSRDGEVYRTVKIGDNEWMAENLRYKTPNSVCLMNNDEYCHLGRYYSLQEPQDWCPEGWHVPTLPEIACVVTKDGCVQIYEGQESLALTVAKTGDENLKVGTKLKINSGWKPAEGIATPTDDLVFSAMAVGFYDGNQFSDQGGGAYFWTSTSDRGSLMIATPEIHTLMGEANPSQAYYWYLYNDSEELGVNTDEKSKYFSIRCIKTKK